VLGVCFVIVDGFGVRFVVSISVCVVVVCGFAFVVSVIFVVNFIELSVVGVLERVLVCD